MNNKRTIHLMPIKDLALNHSVNRCPCKPKKVLSDGCVTFIHRYQDGQLEVLEMLKEAGVAYNGEIFRRMVMIGCR